MAKKQKKENDKIIVVISGGCAEVIQKPAGIFLEIRDYDVEGVDAEQDSRCKTDKDGDWYQEMIWEKEEEF